VRSYAEQRIPQGGTPATQGVGPPHLRGTLAGQAMSADPLSAQSAGELKERMEAERQGDPFVFFRDGEGRQVVATLASGSERLTVGRASASALRLGFDPEVSDLHAELERIGEHWVLVDDGLSRNGSFVNGERVSGRRRLRDGDALRFGSTAVMFRSPATADRAETAAAKDLPDVQSVTETQRRILIALCRPYAAGSEFATPATNRAIGDEVYLSVDAVKAHLRTLFERFGVGDLPQNQKRMRLAELAVTSGVVSPRDLAG
jgi:pSer/pThr/pTyr-binding forkhead associated (FHA) protein